jgi:hypothetical protein
VLAGFIVAIVANVSGFWSRTSGRVSAEAQARFILDQVVLDLQSSLYRDDGAAWLAVTIPANTNNTGLWNTTGAVAAALKPANNAGSLQGIATGALDQARFGIAGAWLRFFTVKRGANTAGQPATFSAPVAVGYQIVRRSISGADNRNPVDRRYLLHRAEVRPARISAASTRNGVLETGFNLAAAAYAPAGGGGVQAGDPGELRYPTINSVIGENVIDFGVRLYVRDATAADGLRRVFPASNTTLTYLARSPATLPAATDPFPAVADVMVRVLTDEGASAIASYERGAVTAPQGVTAQAYWWQLAVAGSQVFTRRIVINGGAL